MAPPSRASPFSRQPVGNEANEATTTTVEPSNVYSPPEPAQLCPGRMFVYEDLPEEHGTQEGLFPLFCSVGRCQVFCSVSAGLWLFLSRWSFFGFVSPRPPVHKRPRFKEEATERVLGAPLGQCPPFASFRSRWACGWLGSLVGLVGKRRQRERGKKKPTKKETRVPRKWTPKVI